MKLSKIYRLAAERYASELDASPAISYGACAMISWTQESHDGRPHVYTTDPAVLFFKSIFAPTPEDQVTGAWWYENDKEARIIALLLASEIAKDLEKEGVL